MRFPPEIGRVHTAGSIRGKTLILGFSLPTVYRLLDNVQDIVDKNNAHDIVDSKL